MFERIIFNQLEEVWIRGDIKAGYIESIEEIRYLQSKENKNIQKIILKQTRIKDIEKLIDILSSFPKLELLNIEGNKIEKERIKRVIEKIKEKKFEKLKIQYN